MRRLHVLVALAAAALIAAEAQQHEVQMGPYPGMSTSLSGSLVVSTTPDGYVRIVGTVTGAGSNQNAGIHVHDGFRCDSADYVGGHFTLGFDEPDPWGTTTYTSSAGTANVDITSSDSRVTMQHVLGRVVVMHAMGGARIGCGQILPSSGSSTPFMMYAQLTQYPGYDTGDFSGDTPKAAYASLQRYPGYDNDQEYYLGTVRAWSTPGSTVMNYAYHLTGLMPASDPNNTLAQGQIHVHKGRGCPYSRTIPCDSPGDCPTEMVYPDGIGEHWWDNDTMRDPWIGNRYNPANGAGESIGTFTIDDGYTPDMHVSHAVVVHDDTGARASCAELVYAPRAQGYVLIENNTVAETVNLTANLAGLERSDGQNPSRGQVHIHSGCSCDNASNVGGHLFSYRTGLDPWTPGAQYYHVDSAWARPGASPSPSPILAYEAFIMPYGPDSSVDGLVAVFRQGGVVYVTSALNGLGHVNCSTSGSACGQHIHAGTACTNSILQGGHLLKPSDNTDPWSGTGLDADNTTSVQDMWNAPIIRVGTDYPDLSGKPFVVHDHTGARAGCGILMQVSTTSYTASLSEYTSSRVTGSVNVVAANFALHVSGSVQGLSPGVMPVPQTSGAGGAHVHAGTGCASLADQSGHYWSDTAADDKNLPHGTMIDPWKGFSYVGRGRSAAYPLMGNDPFAFPVLVGNNYTTVAGKPFVLHGLTGERVACGVLANSSSSPTTSATLPHPKGISNTASFRVQGYTPEDISGHVVVLHDSLNGRLACGVIHCVGTGCPGVCTPTPIPPNPSAPPSRSPDPSPQPVDGHDSSSGPSGGTIAAAVLLPILGLAAVAGGVVLCRKKKITRATVGDLGNNLRAKMGV